MIEVDELEVRLGEGLAQPRLVEDPVGIPAVPLPLGDEDFAGPERTEHLGCRTHKGGVRVDMGRCPAWLDQVRLEQNRLSRDPSWQDAEFRESSRTFVSRSVSYESAVGDEDRGTPAPFRRVEGKLGRHSPGSQHARTE